MCVRKLVGKGQGGRVSRTRQDIQERLYQEQQELSESPFYGTAVHWEVTWRPWDRSYLYSTWFKSFGDTGHGGGFL
jgi:hypothetical protein